MLHEIKEQDKKIDSTGLYVCIQMERSMTLKCLED